MFDMTELQVNVFWSDFAPGETTMDKFESTDTKVKAIIAKLHDELGSDAEVSAVTQLSKSQVYKLRHGILPGTSKTFNRIKKAMGMTGRDRSGRKELLENEQLERLK